MFNNSIGKEALQSITTGNRNFSMGYGSLFNLTNGNSIVLIGIGSQYNNISASNNLSIGDRSLNLTKLQLKYCYRKRSFLI